MAKVVNGDAFPYMQLFYLVLCRIAEPVALASQMPYAFDMLRHLLPEDRVDDASFYAGIFVAAFSFAECMTGILWGTLSDAIGRKPVLLLGCGGSLVALLVVGFSTSVWMAILGRGLCGLLNGNIGVVQTMVGEVVTNPKHEVRAFALMPFFSSIGLTFGPVVGGTFAEPVKAFPSVFSHDSIFATFPYLLPNLICAGMLLITLITVLGFLEETHPKKGRHRGGTKDLGSTAAAPTLEESEVEPLLPTTATDINTYQSFPTPYTNPSVAKAIPFRVWMLILAIALKSAHTVTLLQLLPIFFRTPPDTTVPRYYLGGVGGLGVSLQHVGLYMGINGVAGISVQVLIYPLVTSLLGTARTLRMVATLHPLVYFIVPYLAFVPAGSSRTASICAWLLFRNCFSMLVMPLLYIFLKRATPSPLMLGRVNGFATSVAAGMKTLAPLLAGWLQQVGEKKHLSALVWWESGAVAAVGAVQCWFLEIPEK